VASDYALTVHLRGRRNSSESTSAVKYTAGTDHSDALIHVPVAD